MIKKIKIWTIVLHSMIIIGFGHGIGFMGFIDLIGVFNIPNALQNGIKLSFNGTFEDRMPLIIILSITGKLFLVLSIFLKPKLNKIITVLIGLIFLWITVYLLSLGNWNYSSVFEIAFWSSTPFLMCSFLLCFCLMKNIYESLPKAYKNRNKKMSV